MEPKLQPQAENQGTTEEQQTNDPRVEQALGIFADLTALEVTPAAQIGAREILSAGQIVVRRPRDNEFVRVSGDLQHTLTTMIYTDRDSGEVYFVAPALRPLMIAGVSTKLLTLAVNQVGSPFIWPVPVDDEFSRKNAWNETHRAGYQRAKTDWVKLVSDRGAGHYRIYLAEGELPAPTWPQKSFAELLALAFANHQIDNADHPVIKAQHGLTDGAAISRCRDRRL